MNNFPAEGVFETDLRSDNRARFPKGDLVFFLFLSKRAKISPPNEKITEPLSFLFHLSIAVTLCRMQSLPTSVREKASGPKRPVMDCNLPHGTVCGTEANLDTFIFCKTPWSFFNASFSSFSSLFACRKYKAGATALSFSDCSSCLQYSNGKPQFCSAAGLRLNSSKLVLKRDSSALPRARSGG